MDSVKTELFSIMIIYVGMGVLAWYFLTHNWWFFILLALNLAIVYIIVHAKCHEIDFIRKVGEKLLTFLMKKYGGEWLRDAQNVKEFLMKKKVKNDVD